MFTEPAFSGGKGDRLRPDGLIRVMRGKKQWTVPWGAKQGRGRGSFVASVEMLVQAFYHDVVQDLTAWVLPAPRIAPPEKPPEAEKMAGAKVKTENDGESAESEGPAVAPL